MLALSHALSGSQSTLSSPHSPRDYSSRETWVLLPEKNEDYSEFFLMMPILSGRYPSLRQCCQHWLVTYSGKWHVSRSDMCHFWVEVSRMWACSAMLSHPTALSQIRAAPSVWDLEWRWQRADSELIHLNKQCGQQISLCCKPLNSRFVTEATLSLNWLIKSAKTTDVHNIELFILTCTLILLFKISKKPITKFNAHFNYTSKLHSLPPQGRGS